MARDIVRSTGRAVAGPALGRFLVPAVLGPALRGWVVGGLAIEAEQRRLFPWLAVAFGAGILVFFTATDGMPALWAPLAAAAVCAATLPFLGGRPVALAVALGLAAAFLGFSASALRVSRVASPVLTRTMIAPLEGLIESLEEREEGARLVVRVASLGTMTAAERPVRARVSFKKAPPLRPGDFIAATARLLRPRRRRGRAATTSPRRLLPRHRRGRLLVGKDRGEAAAGAGAVVAPPCGCGGRRPKRAHPPDHRRQRRPGRRGRRRPRDRQARADRAGDQRHAAGGRNLSRRFYLWTPHGAGGRRRVLARAGRARAGAVPRAGLADQEDRRGAGDGRRHCLLRLLRLGHRRRALARDDPDHARRDPGRPPGAQHAQPRARRDDCAGARAGRSARPELPDVVRGGGRPHRLRPADRRAPVPPRRRRADRPADRARADDGRRHARHDAGGAGRHRTLRDLPLPDGAALRAHRQRADPAACVARGNAGGGARHRRLPVRPRSAGLVADGPGGAGDADDLRLDRGARARQRGGAGLRHRGARVPRRSAPARDAAGLAPALARPPAGAARARPRDDAGTLRHLRRPAGRRCRGTPRRRQPRRSGQALELRAGAMAEGRRRRPDRRAGDRGRYVRPDRLRPAARRWPCGGRC